MLGLLQVRTKVNRLLVMRNAEESNVVDYPVADEVKLDRALVRPLSSARLGDPI